MYAQRHNTLIHTQAHTSTQMPPCLIPQESVKFDYHDFYKHTPYESRHSIHQEEGAGRRRGPRQRDGDDVMLGRSVDSCCALLNTTHKKTVSCSMYVRNAIFSSKCVHFIANGNASQCDQHTDLSLILINITVSSRPIHPFSSMLL